MDSVKSSCSRTRSGLIRKKGIFALSRASCSRTRSGFLRVKSFVDSSDVSSSRTRSGLLGVKNFVDSSDGSCSTSQSDLVSGSPPIAEAIIDDKAAMKESPDGLMKEEMPVRTRDGLVRQSSTDKAVTKDESGTKALPDGCLSEDMPSRTRSGLIRRNPTVKTLSKDQSVIKGLADRCLKEDKPLGTRSGLARGSLAAKAELVTKGQPDGWLENDKAAGIRSDLGGGRLATKASKTVSEDKRVVEGLPDGWRKEYRPRKNGSFPDAYYIDPVSGYQFRSLKDVHRYLETGDISQCAVRPKKSTICKAHITENQTHTSASSQHTRPGTADKGIQCEILTSDGIMVPWEELITPYNGNDTEHTVLREPESLKAIQGYGDKLETSERMGVQPVSAHNGSRQTKSVKRKEPNAEVKSKKRKIRSVTPVRVSPRLAVLNAQLEVSIEHEDDMVSINHVNRVQTIEERTMDQTQKSQSGSVDQMHGLERTMDQTQKSQSGSVDQMHGNLESTFSPLQSSQVDTATGIQAIQENTAIHSQPSQLDTLHPTQKKQENSANQLQTVLTDSLIPKQTTQECTMDQPNQPDINHIHTDEEFTGNQFRSSLPADALISLGDIEECTKDHSQPSNTDTTGQIQANEDQVQLSLAETVIPVPSIREYPTCYSQLSKADTTNQTEANQEYIADQVRSSLTDTLIPVRGIEEYTTEYSHIRKADITNQIQANQENTDDHLYLSQVDCAPQMQIVVENLSNQPQLSQSDIGDRIQIDLESTINHLQSGKHYQSDIGNENSMLQSGFAWAPEQNGGAPNTDFWKNVESQASSVSMPMNGAPVASFPANVRFHSTAAAAEPALPPQVASTETGSDQSGLAIQSLFENIWSDPCIEFAFKTLTGDIPVLDDTMAVTNYFPEQQDLNKGPASNFAGSVFDNSRNHTQVDVNLPPPTPDDFYNNGSWFPPQ